MWSSAALRTIVTGVPLLGLFQYYSANFLLDWLLHKLWSNLQVPLSATSVVDLLFPSKEVYKLPT